MRKLYFFIALSLFVGRTNAQSPVQYSVENEITHGFLFDFSYDTVALEISYVMDYFNKPHDYRLDAPAPVKLSWTHQDGADSQRLEVSESSEYANPMIFALDKDAAEYDLSNMIPGRTYYWRVISVKDGAETTAGSGILKPTGMLRWILAEGTWNVRDMGGWPGLGGNPIKYGQIFRGAQLKGKGESTNLVTEAGIEAMRNAGIRAELDLRSKDQAPSSISALAEKDAQGNWDVDFLLVPESSGARMCNFDKSDVTIRELQWVIDELKADKPVYYHCQNGADRTGTLGFLIGALLGMGESDLAKDYELTTFCEVDAAKYDPTEKGFARLRNYEGKKGSPLSGGDNADEYKYAKLVEKMVNVSPSGATYQRKIYNFFLNGNGSKSSAKISEADLDWFIQYMVDYVLAKKISSYNKVSRTKEHQIGETHNLNVVVSPSNYTGKIKYTSSNPDVATVSDDGVITAVKGGSAKITFEIDGLSQSVTFKVQTIESKIPVSTTYNGNLYFIKDDNYIKNGSFEYGGGYTNWKTGKGTAMSDAGFALKNYENSSRLYVESKTDGDESSEGSIKMKWGVASNAAYVFGYNVKNSTSQKNEKNANLKAMILDYETEDLADAKVFDAPTYDGEWTEVQHVFFADQTHDAVVIEFTHLSNDSNNTCFDNFYLAEIDTITGIKNIILPTFEGPTYDINGREVDDNTRGLKIKDGKKVLIFE